METYDFQYIIKTDLDVVMNYTLWINAIVSQPEQPVLYTGFSCFKHVRVEYPWCSGMGYLLHRSVIPTILSFPESDYDIPEDRTVGKILTKAGLVFSGLFFKGFEMLKDLNWPISYGTIMKYHCVNAKAGFRVILERVPAVHFNGNTNHMKGCWEFSHGHCSTP